MHAELHASTELQNTQNTLVGRMWPACRSLGGTVINRVEEGFAASVLVFVCPFVDFRISEKVRSIEFFLDKKYTQGRFKAEAINEIAWGPEKPGCILQVFTP
jgi:hypothetical protein